MRRRIAITGLGVISPLGSTIQENWDALLKGTPGIDRISSFPDTSLPIQKAGEIKNFNPQSYRIKPKSLKVMNRTIQYAVAATALAVEDAQVTEQNYRPDEVGLTLGVNGIQYEPDDALLASYEAVGKDMRNYMDAEEKNSGHPITTKDPDLAVNPLWPLSVLANMSLCHISIHNNFQGPNMSFSSIDAGGAFAIGEAFKSIRHGENHTYIAGGSCALNITDILSLSSLNLLSEKTETCRPFDRFRDGCVIGEGAAMMVMEELEHAKKRGAKIYAEIVGFGSFFDGKDNSLNEGLYRQGMDKCMESALDDASVPADDIDYINADGKGTPAGDMMEARAIKKVFGPTKTTTHVSTSKPLTGHMLSASSSFEAVSSVLSLKEECIPPTKNCIEKDPECDISVVTGQAVKKEIRYAMSTSFGFTGEHTALLFKKYP